MLTESEQYTDRSQNYFEERYRERVLHNHSQCANKMGTGAAPPEV